MVLIEPRSASRRGPARATRLGATVVLIAVAAACGGGDPSRAASDVGDTTAPAAASTLELAPTTAPTTLAPTTLPATAPSPTGTEPTSATTRAPSPPEPAASPPADPRVARLTAADLGASWHPGCPVGPADLRRVTVTYVGFDGVEHDGALVVHADAVRAAEAAFDRLRASRFPIRRVVPVDRYGASDDASMADDNTSAFNCRPSTGSTSTWSQHAYGRAVDVNPLENPYVSGSSVQPPAGGAYLDRTDVRTGMAVPGGPLVSAFAAAGWGWGGNWSTLKDYQHFSASGR